MKKIYVIILLMLIIFCLYIVIRMGFYLEILEFKIFYFGFIMGLLLMYGIYLIIRILSFNEKG